MDWIQQWQSKLNKQNGVAPLVRTGGSRHTGLAALPHRNIHLRKKAKGLLCGSFGMTLPHPVLQRLVKAAQAERE